MWRSRAPPTRPRSRRRWRLLSVDVDASDFEEVGAFLLRVRRDRQMPE